MNGADMSLRAATRYFAVFLLSVSVILGQDGWGVTYISPHICALKGSTVNISCTYRYPPRGNDGDTTGERTLWFTKMQDKDPVDLRTDPEYAGRVQYNCRSNICTLTITDLRESDSAEYKFTFITSQPDRSFTDEPGVKLSVTELQVQMSRMKKCYSSCTYADLRCINSCSLPYDSSYIWYKNGQKEREPRSWYSYFYPQDSISCALEQHPSFPSPSVCVGGQSCNRVTYTERNICAFKGSSVNISCTYNSFEDITSKFWFSTEGRYYWWYRSKDLTEDPKYSDRVRVFETARRRSTLRITNLKQSDSAQYRFKFKTANFEWKSSLPATTLTVTDPDLRVQVIWSPTGPKLVCHSSCLLTGRSSFVWFKNNREINDETSFSYGGNVNPADSYSCAYEGYHSAPVYAPKVPLVSMNPPGDMMEGDSVTLNCSSDANPPAKYTWYKKKQKLLSKQPLQLFLSSIQSSDSGQYSCSAENELGTRTSEYVLINVKYAPKLPSVSVNPSGEIIEGSSVTLTCSSDANPAASYNWYKENQPLLQGPEGIYRFSSISSEDSGNYYCRAENQYDQINSTFLNLDVQYAPKLPSVSVSPSAEVMEGSSVNLTCSSDANPAANYTWYKENEDSPAASGPIFTITDTRPEHSGNYYCEAKNKRGRHSSTLYLTVAGAWRSVAMRIITAVLLVLVLLVVFLLIRRKTCITQRSNSGEKTDNRTPRDEFNNVNMGTMYDLVSAATPGQPAEQRDDLHYSSVRFIQNQEDALYSNVGPARPPRPTEEEEEEDKDSVEYTVVKADGDNRTPQTRCEGDGEDSFALYSTVRK